ncbi:HK97 family phage major capsid protein/HK97 family phage prohead protease [Actinokineospora baliensis]|uniref:phage major capsid protein n=1 Tax=Actinokineospora baliensis TaxID=547056 RepID=UPI00195607B4|nr:phage major capsid protein [Actinokineospora baliensis]MBM7770902.1 HK97 family phage major capsid protein/HK97 family phage prohead protease [Actinokineospora baliensis]
MTVERRDLTHDVEVRAVGETFKLRGYAYVFDKLSHDLGGFRERIERGAGRADMESGHLIATFNHDPSAPLGRTGYGLRTGVDDVGGWYEVDLPDTTAGRDVAELVKRRVIRGSSFTFRLKDDEADQEWTRDDATGFLIRTVRDFHVAELGPVTSPAYPDTTAARRSIPAALRHHVSGKPARVSPAQVKEGNTPLTSDATSTGHERAHVENALQRAADDNRPDAEARLLDVLDRLDARLSALTTEERTTSAVDEFRDRVSALLDEHGIPARPTQQSDPTAEFRARVLELVTEHGVPTVPTVPKAEQEARQLRALAPGEATEFRGMLGVTVDATNKQVGKATPEKTLFTQLMEVIGERSSVITNGARTITTRSGEPIEFPRVYPTPSTGRPTEGSQIPENYPTTDKAPVAVAKYGHLSWVPTELIEEDAVDLIGFLAEDAGPNIADQMNRDFMAALLSTDRGVHPSLRFAPTTLGSESAALDHVTDAFYAIPTPLANRATWLTGRETVSRLRKIKDADGNYMLKSISDGSALTMFSRPVEVDPALSGANKNKIVLSDLSGFLVRYVGSLRVARSVDAKFSEDQVGFRFIHRGGGALLNTTGSVLLTLPAVAAA